MSTAFIFYSSTPFISYSSIDSSTAFSGYTSADILTAFISFFSTDVSLLNACTSTDTSNPFRSQVSLNNNKNNNSQNIHCSYTIYSNCSQCLHFSQSHYIPVYALELAAIPFMTSTFTDTSSWTYHGHFGCHFHSSQCSNFNWIFNSFQHFHLNFTLTLWLQ